MLEYSKQNEMNWKKQPTLHKVVKFGKFRDVRNAIKKEIKETNYHFHRSAKEVWHTIHRIIKPNILRTNSSMTAGIWDVLPYP